MILLFLLKIAQAVPIEYLPLQKSPPSQRSYPVMDYYKAGDMLLVFSGQDSTGATNDLWSYSFNTSYWAAIVPFTTAAPCIS